MPLRPSRRIPRRRTNRSSNSRLQQAGTPGNVPPASQAGPEAAAGTAPAAGSANSCFPRISKHSFVNGPRAFPTLIAPYVPIHIDEPNLVNSPRIDQLIHDNKLEITLQDAVELALENSLDIAVARYTPWIADTDILRTKAGGQGLGTQGADFGTSHANITPNNPHVSYDPIITAVAEIDSRTTAVNNPFLVRNRRGQQYSDRLALSRHHFQSRV